MLKKDFVAGRCLVSLSLVFESCVMSLVFSVLCLVQKRDFEGTWVPCGMCLLNPLSTTFALLGFSLDFLSISITPIGRVFTLTQDFNSGRLNENKIDLDRFFLKTMTMETTMKTMTMETTMKQQ